ncbi:MAG: hypothetical protein WBA51_07980 [Erythrobacter sp.]
MIDDTDLDAAVAANQITPTQAQRLRRFAAERRADPPPIQEDSHFRYRFSWQSVLTGFALLLVLSGLSMAGGMALGPFAVIPVLAFGGWAALRFAERRDGFATTFLCIMLISAWATAANMLASAITPNGALQVVITACLAAIGSAAFWYVLRLPIAFTIAYASLAMGGDGVLSYAFGTVPDAVQIAYVAGVGIVGFLIALWWDMTDIHRQTIRSDIAFWMHLYSAVHLVWGGARAIYGSSGDGSAWGIDISNMDSPDTLAVTVAAYVLCIVMALVSDRRMILFMSSVYTMLAFASVSQAMQSVTFLVIGGIVVSAALFWERIRTTILDQLPPQMAAQFPRASPHMHAERPVY